MPKLEMGGGGAYRGGSYTISLVMRRPQTTNCNFQCKTHMSQLRTCVGFKVIRALEILKGPQIKKFKKQKKLPPLMNPCSDKVERTLVSKENKQVRIWVGVSISFIGEFSNFCQIST